ncbi:pyrroline-5-carboxylate reductase [Stutzerimonas stutzeri]|uniref:Pyrroline-5-carboxylate reductase n=1 Tax=Stutzerimonas stutzeri TaxID=316 RepID=W8R4D3_STUST|nr:NAD(P)-binding domain-containing protein [Stutzerimonas stutzeri]AHL74373.1 pyrroline-5-carboxylate reductase [Stutzerimonas stutzeri]MCQ4328898.1 NAD(P)-binding domain-containing protein [Stutzerimonas stutzeri]
MQNLGILGVGELTEKVVLGLRRGGYDGNIYLSPRNHERATSLLADSGCHLMESNQAVVDRADCLLLGVRPEAVPVVAREVTLKPGQLLISLAAGVSLDALAEHFPEARCIRAMLSYAAQINQSMVVVCPPDAEAERALKSLGNLVVLDQEPAFELATVAACMNGWFYFLLHDLQQWLTEKGLPSDKARDLVLGNLQDCVASARHQPEHALSTLGQNIATPGTFTANGLDVLNHQQASAPWGAACEIVLDALLTRPNR